MIEVKEKTAEQLKELELAKGKENNTHLLRGLFDIISKSDTNLVIRIRSAELTHPEHKKLTFSNEKIIVAKQVEFDPFEKVVRSVQD